MRLLSIWVRDNLLFFFFFGGHTNCVSLKLSFRHFANTKLNTQHSVLQRVKSTTILFELCAILAREWLTLENTVQMNFSAILQLILLFFRLVSLKTQKFVVTFTGMCMLPNQRANELVYRMMKTSRWKSNGTRYILCRLKLFSLVTSIFFFILQPNWKERKTRARSVRMLACVFRMCVYGAMPLCEWACVPVCELYPIYAYTYIGMIHTIRSRKMNKKETLKIGWLACSCLYLDWMACACVVCSKLCENILFECFVYTTRISRFVEVFFRSLSCSLSLPFSLSLSLSLSRFPRC